MSKIRQFVSHSFKTYPVVTNSLLYGSLFVAAELSQQVMTKKVLTEEPKPIDGHALMRYGVFGTGIQGPVLTLWYKMLDKAFVGTGVKIVAKKLILDQFLMTPPLYISFFVAMSLMEGKADILKECKDKFLPAFKISCMFWIPAQTINFLLIPPVFRVVYVGSCAFAWVNILCWIKRQTY